MMNNLTYLELYLEWGVDWALEQTPKNHFISTPQASETVSLHKRSKKDNLPLPPSLPKTPAQIAKRHIGNLSQNDFEPKQFLNTESSIVQQARLLAQSTSTLKELQDLTKSFSLCPLFDTATHTIPAYIPDTFSTPKLLIVGDTPDDNEDLTGLPLAGESQFILTQIFGSIGINTQHVAYIPIIPWRPPGGRKPTPYELSVYLPLLQRFIALLQPQAIITLGQIPTQTLLHTSERISHLRGTWHTIPFTGEPLTYPLFSIRHPILAMKSPKLKKELWEDLKIFFINFMLNRNNIVL